MPKRPELSRPPVVRPIASDQDVADLFQALAGLPGRVWLDSATVQTSVDEVVRRLSRYSFLSADPVKRLSVFPDQPNPWPELSRWVNALPDAFDASLPPFQGGLMGVIGYEAARWLEPEALAECHLHQDNDLPTPAMSFGVFDWTIAIDHFENRSWLICQGFTAEDLDLGGESSQASAASRRLRCAGERADQICDLISGVKPQGDHTPHQLHRVDSPPDAPGDVTSNFTGEGFRASVADIVERIRGGDSFQVNLAQRLTTASSLDPAALYLRLRSANPAPFAGYYDGGDFQVLSSSPEGFLQLRDRHVETRPIKGTVPRTGDEAADADLAATLLASEKDRAENVMIVDLMRNDLSRVCRDESVVVSRLCEIERYQFVQHLVSVVEGDLVDGVDAVDVVMACFPGGSVTGAPKIEAMKTIAELEPHPRGPYCGSMGYFSCGGDADFNILIRTITATAGRLQIPVGGGITARSNPEAEEAETWAKATGMLNALPTESPQIEFTR
ncbi:anthranilate synthase component I family protein [Stieleria sp. ICT_E10.1]|uniref:anthranilate synthase component I family protein n=1 Tax=Stieleria sedimenti TaxID=2976331 RepID=UPI00217FFB4F|nr:anthranilate synthase component I family protein [Stieleria sedimenti]MCS7470048.1 anthranilate synthase component I family protein [Stieleria sedimenti]